MHGPRRWSGGPGAFQAAGDRVTGISAAALVYPAKTLLSDVLGADDKIRALANERQPSNVVKKAAVQTYGGEITECEPTLAAREETLERLVARHGSHVVHPYDDPRIIAGQGTVGLELVEQLDAFDVVVVPVGGGGFGFTVQYTP